MLDLELFPGHSAGFFVLGMPIFEAIGCIQAKANIVAQVNFKYNDKEPLSQDLIIDLCQDGVLLRFTPDTQRLKMIEIYKVHRIRLQYSGTIFCYGDSTSMPIGDSVASVTPTFINIYRRLGLSYPGEFSEDLSFYTLHYPGLSFRFPIPVQHRPFYEVKLRDGDHEHSHPEEFPDGRSPVTSRIFVYHLPKKAKETRQEISLPLNPSPPPQESRDFYFEPIVNQGIYFTKRNCTITFSSTPQDVVSMVGPPEDIFFKEEDKMRIHSLSTSSSSLSNLKSGRGDYFYNYFSLGLDLLFDRASHQVKKFILHSNFPNHHEFNRYAKCNFSLIKYSGQDPLSLLRSLPPPPAIAQQSEQLSEDILKSELRSISPDSKWEEIQEIFGRGGRPVVNDKGSAENPFGPTFFHGFNSVIFEVMKNSHIASVLFFHKR